MNAPLAVAFEIFAGQAWWPVETHHLAEPPGCEVVLEPFIGGRRYERGSNGYGTDWGKVLIWQPPYWLLLTWQVSPARPHQEDPTLGSEIEVTFTAQSPDVTRVDLTRRHLERYGAHTERMRSILVDRGGELLEVVARLITATPPDQ